MVAEGKSKHLGMRSERVYDRGEEREVERAGRGEKGKRAHVWICCGRDARALLVMQVDCLASRA